MKIFSPASVGLFVFMGYTIGFSLEEQEKIEPF